MANENNDVRVKSYGFTKANFIIIVTSLIAIILGYFLMSGGKSSDGVSFDPTVFSTLRIKVAPVVLTLGYVGILIGVLWRSKKGNTENYK